ncbi:hypothetical protein D3C81_1811410 [compost metagenome]
MRLIEGFGIAQIQLGYLQIMLVVQTRHFVKHLDIDTFVRLQTDGQLVLRQILPGFFKQVKFRRFEVHHHFRALGRQTLTGTQVKRHARPAPVVDIHTDSNKGFGVAGLVRTLFFQVSRYFFTLRKTGGVLTTHRGFTHVRTIDTTQ